MTTQLVKKVSHAYFFLLLYQLTFFFFHFFSLTIKFFNTITSQTGSIFENVYKRKVKNKTKEVFFYVPDSSICIAIITVMGGLNPNLFQYA